MNWFKKLFGGLNPNKVIFQRDENRPHPSAPHINVTKKIYKTKNKEAALMFLRRQNVTKPFYYIEVDTPSGRFGIDNAGKIYDNRGRFI
ncbi:MAG: hypothetical protein ACOYLO_14610 [Ferruginibacter sp.]